MLRQVEGLYLFAIRSLKGRGRKQDGVKAETEL